ncbi:hypothetical protein AB4345_03365 [Vibrio breoganii]|uniref:hypothetical protein n=1 Tax=Vibrio breoganii TaxID=553239 RepID=UPI000C82464D|nr:hypothetical protein [Vibrio breoganii]PML16583.1 hypothetical protein BCT84_20505 [Vibrio breoganii]PML32144.1 hypothetical protein BCT78_16270 [Vibrio breoganii]
MFFDEAGFGLGTLGAGISLVPGGAYVGIGIGVLSGATSIGGALLADEPNNALSKELFKTLLPNRLVGQPVALVKGTKAVSDFVGSMFEGVAEAIKFGFSEGLSHFLDKEPDC